MLRMTLPCGELQTYLDIFLLVFPDAHTVYMASIIGLKAKQCCSINSCD